MPITELMAGLEMIKLKNSDAPVIANPYVVTVPAVKKADFSSGDQTIMDGLGWLEHPVYLSYYYPAFTLTELADVTGEAAKEVPVFEPFTPPLPFTQ
jgi:hypothetical protein